MLFRVKHVEAAIESEAVDTLLICDSLFRSQNLAERKRYVKIVDSVREGSGTVRIFSSLHVSGERKFRLYSQNSERGPPQRISRPPFLQIRSVTIVTLACRTRLFEFVSLVLV